MLFSDRSDGPNNLLSVGNPSGYTAVPLGPVEDRCYEYSQTYGVISYESADGYVVHYRNVAFDHNGVADLIQPLNEQISIQRSLNE